MAGAYRRHRCHGRVRSKPRRHNQVIALALSQKMRDPQAAIVFHPERVERQLYQALPADHFLRSRLARQLVKQGQLVPYSVLSDTRIESPRVPFVTYPYEWCDAQFHDAAQATLGLLKAVNAQGYDLKDASAWNILFVGCKPQFCDLMSFEPLTSQRWWALGQFVRHFIWPLLVARRRRLACRKSFLTWRDGVPTEKIPKLLGPLVYFSRYLPFLLGGSAAGAPSAAVPVDQVGAFRRSVIEMLDWCLPKAAGPKKSAWVNYEQDRDHYNAEAINFKKATVAKWLADIRPEWVADLGCNSGEFSLLAADAGARVVAVDADHACIQNLYQRAQGRTDVFPVVAALDDIVGGRGWQGSEFASLGQRLSGLCDVVFGLALIHHLTIGASVPLLAVAAFLYALTKQWAVLELIDSEDSQLQSLCATRNRNPCDFSVNAQKAALVAAGFVIQEVQPITNTHRQLVLFRRAIIL